MQKQLSRALARGASGSGAFEQPRLPIFPRAIKECTTADSSPYLCSVDELTRRYGFNPHRLHLIDQLASFAGQSYDIGVKIGALLIGGSFLDQSIDQPRDIDCLVYYRIDAQADAVDAIISQWNALRRGFPLDVKLCPTDAGPLTIIKRSIFFSNLFSIDKATLVLERGTILVELPNEKFDNEINP